MADRTDLATVIADFLDDARAGLIQGPTGQPFTHDELRELRGSLARADAELGTMELGAIRGTHVQTLVAELRAAGLSPGRVRATVDALGRVNAYAIGRGLVTARPASARAAAPVRPRSPSDTMLAFGQQAVWWTMSVIVVLAAMVVGIGIVFVFG